MIQRHDRNTSANTHTHTHHILTHTQCRLHNRIIGQVHRGLKCTTALFVEQNIMFPRYHTVEYGEPALLALGEMELRIGPSN